MDWYYAPWQYDLRKQVQGEDTELMKAIGLSRRVGIPPVVGGVVYGTTAFLAYTPLLQPGPPAKTPVEGTLPIVTLGGGLIV